MRHHEVIISIWLQCPHRWRVLKEKYDDWVTLLVRLRCVFNFKMKTNGNGEKEKWKKSLNKTSQAINVMSLSHHYEDAEEFLINAICIQIYM